MTVRKGVRLHLGVGVVVALLATACGGGVPGGSQGQQGATAAAGEVLGVTLPSFAIGPTTLTEAAEAEVGLAHDLRAEAGIAGLIGPDGAAVLAAIDESQTRYGEKVLPSFADDLQLDLSASALVAGLGRAPGSRPPAPNEWTGSAIGRASFTASMMMGLLTQSIDRAGTSNPSVTLTNTETLQETSGGVTEAITLRTKLTLATGGGRIAGDVEIETTSVMTETATGKRIGTLVGAANGHVDASACPDQDGAAKGRYSLEVAETLTPREGAASAATRSYDGPFSLHDGDDAHLVETDLELGVKAGATGPGLGSGDPDGWSVEAFIPLTIPAKGSPGVDAGRVTSSAQGGATAEQVKGAVQGAMLTVGLAVSLLADGAEKFWRSGKCIDLKTNEESREVDAGETIDLSVDAVHKFDAQPVKAPVEANFTGTKSLDPAGRPVDPPASFTFVAGNKDGDKGTIELTQTGKRGIGLKTVEFTVAGGALLVTYQSKISIDETSASVQLVDVHLSRKGVGMYEGTGSLRYTGIFGTRGCTAPFDETFAARVTGATDETRPDMIRLSMDIPDTGATFPLTCFGITNHVPTREILDIWLSLFERDVEARIGETLTVPAGYPMTGSTTITVTRDR
jgi:hypothetical protein